MKVFYRIAGGALLAALLMTGGLKTASAEQRGGPLIFVQSPPQFQDHSSHQATGSHDAAEDSSMRNMYIAMGAMTGFMFAAMPVTTSAVGAALGAGVVTMWLYDAYLAPLPPR